MGVYFELFSEIVSTNYDEIDLKKYLFLFKYKYFHKKDEPCAEIQWKKNEKTLKKKQKKLFVLDLIWAGLHIPLMK